MKILLNASTICVGGGLFVTVNFIKSTLEDTDNDIQWFYIISNEVDEELYKDDDIYIPIGNKYVAMISPANFYKRRITVRDIKRIEEIFKPDIVYSIGAPSYIRFEAPEVQRLTNPFITHLHKYALRSHDLKSRIKKIIKIKIQRQIIKRGRLFITQSETAKKGIQKLARVNEKDVKVVPNSLSKYFIGRDATKTKQDLLYIFCLAAPYPHKNIIKIPYIAFLLKSRGILSFQFVVTIPFKSNFLNDFKTLVKKYDVSEYIVNVGKISQTDCYKWYLKSEVVFLPTYMETFSATLLEALYLQVPIVTTNFDFNKEICREYAYYFEPNEWEHASEIISGLFTNKANASKKIMPKREFFDRFKSADLAYTETMDFLQSKAYKK